MENKNIGNLSDIDYKSIRHAKFYKDKVLNNSNGYNILRKKGNGFFKKVMFFSFFVFVIKFLQPHLLYYGGGDYTYFIPEIKEEKSFLSDDGFILQKSIQTQKRKKGDGNEIIEYTVQEGDTLSQISVDYQIKIGTLLGSNPGISPTKSLKVGTKIKILPVDGILLPLKKDTLISDLAKSYKIKKEDIISINKLETGALLVKKGTELILPGAKPIILNNSKTYGNSAPKFVNNIKSYDKSTAFIWPTKGKITQYFHKGHYGLDIANVNKGPIFAVADGVIERAFSSGWHGGYGKYILINHGKGIKTLYAHNSKVYVKKGDKVKQGDTIAWMGNSGRVRGRTGIHLHFEVIINGVKRNPLAYIK
ncbi:peptidoglycan DD-metalloendopeptidase family protein [Candidatus Gracilibacteria bacterium]|nr:peptidoglycan DD-metalloendopeptidase family protein [Candidatus Gracilibacteria bacterium]